MAHTGKMALGVVVGLLLGGHPAARATVYGWKGAGGLIMMSNDPADVPSDQQASAWKFTAKAPPDPPPAIATSSPAPRADPSPADAYQRGFESGLQAAERQVALAEVAARTVLAGIPQQAPPAPTIVIAQPPAPQPVYGAPYYGSPYDAVGWGYPPYLYSYPFPSAFGVTFVSRRRFVSGVHGHRFAGGFPHGGFPRGGFPAGRFGRMR